MSSVAAFFDVDETLIKIKSMFHFYKYWCESRCAQQEYNEFNERFKLAIAQGVNRQELNRMYYQQFKQISIDELNDAGERWFVQTFSDKNIFLSPVIAKLQEHKRLGHLTVFVSGSMLPLLKPIAEQLGVDAILCTRLLLDDEGKLTGDIDVPQTIGEGKREALLSYTLNTDIDPENCFGYGDDISDIPMMLATGNPICIGDGTALADYARKNNWAVIGL